MTEKTEKIGGYFIPFALALLVCMASFVALDYGVMKLQGLDLMFRQ